MVGDILTNNDEVPVAYAAGAKSITAEDNEAVVMLSLGLKASTIPPRLDETMLGGMLSTGIDKVTVRGHITFDGDVELPLVGDIEIQVSVDVGPIGNAFASGGRVISDPAVRFASDETTPLTVIEVTSDQTTLVAPYAVYDGTFDTGFAISNMNTKSDQSGTITFELWADGNMVEYTTSSSSPGSALTNGLLESGTTYTVLLSDLLMETGSGLFRGYVKIITDFTGGDGIAYISDWAAFSATATLKEE